MAFARSTDRANYRQQTNYDGPSYRSNRAGDHTQPAPLVHTTPRSPPGAENTQGSRSERREHEDPDGRDGPVSPTQIPASGPVVQEHLVENESPPTPPPPATQSHVKT